jgi:hypothetical protein
MRSIIVVRTPPVPASPSGDPAHLETPLALSLIDLGLKIIDGVTISPKAPVRVPSVSAEEISARASERSSPPLEDVAIEVNFTDANVRRQFLKENADVIVGMYSNPPLRLLGTVCPTGPVGSHGDVSSHMKFTSLHARDFDGRNVRIAIVDNGVNDLEVSIGGGLKHPEFPPPGSGASDHGTMVAFDARIAAPRATFLDYPLMRGPHAGGITVSPFLFDAITVYEALLADYLKAKDTPMVVINSWGIGSLEDDGETTDDLPPSHPDHKFNLAVAALVAAGADVLFAAGNCGGPCGFADCPEEQRGAGNGILGANSHEQVITVGAVTLDDDLLGYSSQGPGQMAAKKPDVLAASHFAGSNAGGEPIDSGTSAACGVAGGIVAALRSKESARKQPAQFIKDTLCHTARQINGAPTGWHPASGHGVIDARAAESRL